MSASDRDPPKSGDGRAGDLRQRAEEAASRLAAKTGLPDTADAAALLHELAVHQVELEMQSADLRDSLRALEESRKIYFNAVEAAPFPIIRFGPEREITECNLAAAEMLELPRRRSRALSAAIFEIRLAPPSRRLWREAFARALADCGPGPTLDLVFKGGGSRAPRVFKTTLHPVHGDGGEGASVLAYFTDVTEDHARIEENRRLSKIAKEMPDPVIFTDASRRIVWVNEAFEQVTGYTAAEALGRNPSFLQGPETDPAAVREMRAALDRGEGFRKTVLNYSKSGRSYWIELAVEPLRDERGALKGWIGIERDITARIRDQARLAQSERKFSLAFMNASHGLIISTLDEGRFLEINDSVVRISGRERAELIGRSSIEAGLWENPRDREEIVRHLTRDGRVNGQEVRLRHKSGRVLTVLVNASLMEFDSRPCILWSVVDLSEIRRRDMLLATATGIASLLLGGGDEDQAVERVLALIARGADAARASLLVIQEQAESLQPVLSFRRWIAPESGGASGSHSGGSVQAALAETPALARIIESGSPADIPPGALLPSELRLAGAPENARLVAAPVCDNEKPSGLLVIEPRYPDTPWEEGEKQALSAIAALLGSFLARRRLEIESLRLHTAIEQSKDSVVITDRAGVILYVNSGFEKTTGYTRAEALGKTPRILKSGRHDAAFYRDMWGTLTAGRSWEGRLINKCKDGRLIHEHAIISPVKNSAGAVTHFVAVKHDITAELEQQSRMMQAQKLESVGRLAGGVAHDFNNMLAAIQLNAELALLLPGLDPRAREHIQGIQSAAERSSRIVRQLLTFARQQPAEPRPVAVNNAIADLMKILRRLVPEQVELRFEPGGDAPPVLIDPGQFDQVVVNLVLNARDAITGSGVIRLATARCELPEGEAPRPGGLPPGVYTCLSVSDTGCGMEESTMSRMMEPFFTTKETGKGSGLGLSIVYSVVEQAGGRVVAESVLGQGSVFRIYLPACAGAPNTAPSASGTVKNSIKASVLVVEDEPAVLDIVSEILKLAGCSVRRAATPGEALRAASGPEARFDLLISDMVMPGMSGNELAAKLLADHPSMRCLFISGYTPEPAQRVLPGGRAAFFLAKPFTAGQLLEMVRKSLA